MKKILSVILAVLMLASVAVVFSSCADKNDDFKLGVILLHDEKSTYDLNFIEAVNKAADELGLKEDQVIFKMNVDESSACYDAAVDLVAQGCNVIFADSFGHEPFMLQAAKEFPDVQFCHATGTTAHTTKEEAPNFHNAFASIYEGRYLAGVAAGMKLKAMMEADSTVVPKVGYVGAFPYAEVISGYTSFYLGVKSIVENATMDVIYTGDWYHENKEKVAALALIEQHNCVLISQHADSMGAPSACEDKGVPNVSYNGSTKDSCPNTFIVSSKIDWTPYIKLICENTMNGEAIPADWTGTIGTGSVALTEVNVNAAVEGTQAKLDEVKADLVAGDLHVFDVNTFTVTVTADKNTKATVDENGKLTGYMADVDTDDAYTGDTEAIKDGYFHESEYRSAPYFDIIIDGITIQSAA